MDNDDAMVGRVLTRRAALRATATAGIGLALMEIGGGRVFADSRAATRPSLPLIASPSLTEGPFFVDEKLNRSDLTAGTTRASVVGGLPLQLAFTIYKVTGQTYAPMAGAQVDVWHADVAGAYSDESNPMNHEDTSRQTWLRGYQVSDSNGVVQFKTIFPGWYSGRTPHIHFKIRQVVASAAAGAASAKLTAEFTSQVFFHEEDLDRLYAVAPYSIAQRRRDTRNADDGVYSERLADGSSAGAQMTLNLRKNSAGSGYESSFPVILTDGSLAAGNGRRGPGGRGGPGGFGPPPGGFRGPPPGGFDGPPF